MAVGLKIKSKNMEPFRLFSMLQPSLLLFVTLTLNLENKWASCETKEFDWSELGVSLSNPKTGLTTNAGNSLRILVGPQRRMTKNYEFEYVNNSQPAMETTYVVPSSSGSYASQSSGQQSQGHSSHASTYSALTASLANLKNRLNARGVSLTSSLADSNSQTGVYPGTANNYAGSSLLNELQSRQSQPNTYYSSLSAGQQDQHQPASYDGGQTQSNDNKTIVLAIPAKINFLTDGRSSSSSSSSSSKQQQALQQPSIQNNEQQQQQPQHLTVIQSAPEHPSRAEYPTKHISLVSSQDGAAVVDHSEQLVARGEPASDQEHHQYVIVNPQAVSSEHPQLVATSAGGQLYPTIQQGAYAMKYINTVQHPTLTKTLYATPSADQIYDSQIYEGRYNNCLDTCNSSDPRWRRYTVSKYKFCCSRSAQYDSQYDQSMGEKSSSDGLTSKHSDDTYYNYLYRRTRSRRSRRPNRLASRHQRYSASATAPSTNDDEGSPVADTGTSEPSRHTSARYYSHTLESPYMKYYKSRLNSNEPQDSSRDSAQESPVAPKNKYTSKDRSYRRGRSRDFDTTEPQQAHDSLEDDSSAYGSQESTRGSLGYGSGEHSVEAGRYPPEPRIPSTVDDEESRSNYDESADQESGKQSDSADYSVADMRPSEPSTAELEAELETGYKYSTASRRNRKRVKSRGSRKGQSAKDVKQYKKQTRKSKHQSKQDSSHINGTDYESASPGEQYYPEPSLSSGSSDEDQSNYQKESSGASQQEADVERDAISLFTKYKLSLNESTVANLSRTAMHLKEILTILEKRAQIKANESTATGGSQTTSTPAPTTTTSIYSLPLLSSQYGGSSLTSGLPSDFLTSELSLKSPYRFESSALSSSLGSSSLPSFPAYSSIASDLASTPFGLPPTKHMSLHAGQHPRKRRVNKNVRYNGMMVPKMHGLSPSSAALLQAASKSPLLSYYSTLHYPHLYGARGNSPSVINSYPYRNLNKNHYASLLNSPVSSKLAAMASSGVYGDDLRFSSLSGYDPIASVASSLRPSGPMRMRSKPYVFQQQVAPIYTRHTILGNQPLDVKK